MGCKLCTFLKASLIADLKRKLASPNGTTSLPSWDHTLKTEDNFLRQNVIDAAGALNAIAQGPFSDQRDIYDLKPKLLDGFEYKCSIASSSVWRSTADVAPSKTIWRQAEPRADILLARSWLTQCQQNHARCSTNANPPCPTRLLIIEERDTGKFLRLAITRDCTGPYVALSHYWGDFKPLLTTTVTYEDHERGIPVDRLPRSFQDAVTATQALGLNKLWIDSLCVIQDSNEDWERECARMADVYSNATVTVAATDAHNSSVGFLKPYPPKDDCSIRLTCDDDISLPNGDLLLESGNFTTVTQERDETSHILGTRGWAFQERLLSPRLLSLGAARMRWDCNNHVRFDNLHGPDDRRHRWERLSGLATRESFESFEGGRPTIRRHWYTMAQKYSMCNLSKAEDKVPALAGLAHAFSQALDDVYVLGIWTSDLHVGLSWFAWNNNTQSRAPDPSGLPSWSWMYHSGEVKFTWWLEHLRNDLIIRTIDETILGTDRFDGSVDGRLFVSGKLKRAIARGGAPSHVTPFNHGFLGRRLALHDATTKARVGDVAFDSRVEERFAECVSGEEEFEVLLVSYTNSFTNVHGWCGLALQSILTDDGNETYRRIGIVFSKDE